MLVGIPRRRQQPTAPACDCNQPFVAREHLFGNAMLVAFLVAPVVRRVLTYLGVMIYGVRSGAIRRGVVYQRKMGVGLGMSVAKAFPPPAPQPCTSVRDTARWAC